LYIYIKVPEFFLRMPFRLGGSMSSPRTGCFGTMGWFAVARQYTSSQFVLVQT